MPYFDGIFLLDLADEIAWFSNAKLIHGVLHRPSFEAENPTATPELACLYHTVLALGACMRGESERCTQSLQAAWTIKGTIGYSQHLHHVQATTLMVCYTLSSLTYLGFLVRFPW